MTKRASTVENNSVWLRKITHMGIDNSLAEFYSALYCDLYVDIAERFGFTSKESRLELAKIRKRVVSEGLQFLTVTLPRFGKAVDTALSKNVLFSVEGFQKKPLTQLPKLFGWLTERIFTESGAERQDADPEALRALRQLVYFLYKLEINYEDKKTQKVISDFIETDEELKNLQIGESKTMDNARNFVSSVFQSFDPRDVLPRHGPGAVATGEKACQKHKFSRIYNQIERFYPFTEYYQFGLMQVCDDYRSYESLHILETGTAKVVLVPKDSRGPRLISCEPLEYQWIQQGLGRKISSHLESNKLTSGHVNFTDQGINRSLALASSVDQEWVTLDMKEASDRVSLQLVENMFRDVPVLLEALKATRTTSTLLPNGITVQLNKFAPMGSNLCFPIESFVFYALSIGVLMHMKGYTRREARALVYVYGDDIIVRREDYPFLLQFFPTVGLMFNDQKCCTAGFFRESCGCDAYKGVDVTPIKLRSVWSHRRRFDIGVIASYVALSNAAYKYGYMRLSNNAKSAVESKTGVLPIFSNENIGGLGFVRADACTRVQPAGVKTRWNNDLHRREVLTRQVGSEYSYSDPNDWSTVLRRFSTPNQYTEPGTYAIPHRSRLKWGWTHLPQ